MKLEIPRKIQLAGIDIEILIDNAMVARESVIGKCQYPVQRIILDTTAAPEDTIKHSYLHELVHYILHIMNHSLKDDEVFVDVFAHLLWQAIKSGEQSLVK